MTSETFLRFTAPDAAELQRATTEMRVQLERAIAHKDTVQILDCAGDLGGMLTTARQELQAQELLTPFLAVARQTPSAEPSAWLIHALATATQYVGNRVTASELFAEALALTKSYGWTKLEHFVWAHWGRCLAEQRRYVQAKECFERSLAIRESLGDPRQESSRRALVALQELVAASGAG